MGYVAILSLLEHTPSGIAARYVPGDHLPGWGATGITCRLNSAGIRYSASGFTIDVTFDKATNEWTSIDTYVEAPTKPEVEGFNKIMRGTNFPRIETDWRAKALCLRLPGNRIPLPVRATADLTGGKVTGPVVVKAGTSGAVSVASVGVAAAKASLAPAPAPTVSPSPVSPARAALSGEPVAAVRAPVSPIRPEPVSAPIKAVHLAPVADPTGVFTWPTKESGIWTEPHVNPELDILWEMHQSGDRQVIALKGPAGTGKTSMAYDLAVRKGVPIAKIDGAGAITFADWVGSTGATERNGASVTEFQPSGFLQAVRADGPMAGIPRMVLLDEVNRSESSAANNALIPCLDHTGSLYVADARRSIPLDPAVMYVMTANIGYAATVALDQALLDRVTHWVPMGYPKPAVEVDLVVERTGLDRSIAVTLVAAAGQIRQVAERGELIEGIGPRRVLVAARKIKAGFNPVRACISTWAESYSDEGGTTSESGIVRSRIEAAFRGY